MASLHMTDMPTADQRPASGERVIALVLALAGLYIFFSQVPDGIADAMRLALPDNDDFMRLLSVRDFLAGQSWFDMTQYRYLPPEGASMHWSRLADLPLLAMVLALKPLFGAGLAERLAVTAEPLALFVVYCGIVAYGAWRVFGLRAAGFTVFMAAQTIAFSDLFAPGRIDHHSIQIVLVAASAIAFGVAPTCRRAAIASGALAGLSLAIGLESLVFVAGVGVAYALHWVVRGGGAAGALRAFGASLALAAALAFAVETSPSNWFVPACDALSAPWLLLTTLGGAAAMVLSLATPRLAAVGARLVAAIVLGVTPVIAFVALYPACLAGPYGDVPEPFRSYWLSRIPEAFPFRDFLAANPSAALQSLMPMLIGALAAGIVAWREGGRRAPMLFMLAGLLGLGVALAQVQIRVVYVASAFVPLAAGWYLDRVIGGLSRPQPIATRLLGLVGGVLMFGLAWAGLVALADMPRGGSATAASIDAEIPCQDPDAVAKLAALPKSVVLGPVNLGPALLLHTDHSIVVAGYHRAVDGLVAAMHAFAGDEAAMRGEVQKHRVDYVAVCPPWRERSGSEPSFAEALAAGKSVPWLAPVDLGGGPLRVWRVVR